MINKKLIVRFFMVIGILVFLFFTFFKFVNVTDRINTQTISEHLEDIGKETANNYNYKYNGLKNVIKSISYSLSEMELEEESIGKILDISAQKNPLFERLWFVDRNRVLHNYTENIEFKETNEYVEKIFEGESGMTNPTLSPFDNENVILVYSPIIKENIIVGGICGVVKMNIENTENIYDDVFENTTYSFMTACNGEIISKVKNQNILYYGKNYLEFLEYDVEYLLGSYDEVLENIKNQKSSFIAYNYKGQERTVYYTPVQLNNWYSFTVISNDVVTSLNSQLNNVATELVFKITLLFMIITFFIVRYFVRINNEHVEMTQKLMTTNRKIEMILKQTSERIFEYDIDTDSLTLDAWNDYPKTIFNHFLSNLHNYSFVSRQHEKLLKDKFKEIIANKKNVSFDARLPYINKDDTAWFHISMAYVPENNGLIGTLHNSTNEMKEYNLLLQDQMFKNSIYSHSYFMFAVNLRSKKVLVYQKDGTYHNVMDVQYDYFIEEFLNQAFEADKIDIESFFSFDHIHNIYYQNDKNTLDFRYLNPQTGMYEWFCFNIEFERQSSNNELLMIAYCVDINAEKVQQLEYEHRAKRDGLTDLYNRQTFHRLVDEYLEKKKPSDYCAYIICDLDNFKMINDTYGHSFGDAVIKEVAHILDLETKKCGYASRYGGDEFMIFFYSQESYAAIENKARQIIQSIKMIKLNKISDISASMGVKFVNNEKSYKELFDKCDKALYASKKSGKGIYTVWKESMEENTGL